MDQGSQDKNLPATERKLQKARDEGQVTRSEDLKHLAVLAVGSMSLLTLSPLALASQPLSLFYVWPPLAPALGE